MLSLLEEVAALTNKELLEELREQRRYIKELKARGTGSQSLRRCTWCGDELGQGSGGLCCYCHQAQLRLDGLEAEALERKLQI